MKVIKHTFPLVLVFLGFLIYSNVLNAPFIFDDKVFIEGNFGIRDLSNFKNLSGTRYISFLSFAVNYYFGGLNTFGYHLVNIVIHILNAILVYFLASLTFTALSLRGASAPKPCPEQSEGTREIASALPRNDITPNLIAFSVSLIFLVHPIQTQAVTYISQRFESLAALFYLLALVLYVKARINTMLNFKCLMLNNSKFKIKHLTLYFLSILSAILAMKTKEISFTLPFIIILYEFTFFKNNGHGSRSRFLYLIPFLLTLAIIPLSLLFGPPSPVEQTLGHDLQSELTTQLLVYDNLLTQFNVIITYIRLLFFPVNQHFDYDYFIAKSIFEPATLLSFIFILIIFCSAVYLYFRSHKTHHAHDFLISFGIFWFFITLSPHLLLSGVVFEHWLYLPSIGFILSMVTVYYYLFDCVKHKTIRMTLPFFIIIIIIIVIAALLLSIAAYKRNIIYNDIVGIWLDEIDKSPKPRAHLYKGLGDAYRDKGMSDEAIREYLVALELDPNSLIGHNSLGSIYYNQGRLNEAIKEYMTALKINPDYEDAHNNLGVAYSNRGSTDDAIREYLAALKLDPNHAEAHNNLGLIHFEQGRFDKAIMEYMTALKINPDYIEAHYNLGLLYYRVSQSDEAIKELLTVLKLKPDFTEAHNNLGFIYYIHGRADDAIKEYLAALKLKPDYANAHYNIGKVYQIKGLKDKAREEFEIALKLKPDYIQAQKAIESLDIK